MYFMAAKPTIITYDQEFDSHHNRYAMYAILEAAREGSKITKDWFNKAFQNGAGVGIDSDALLGVQQKNNDWDHLDFQDAFTQADIDSEKAIIRILKQHKNIPIVAEESGHEVADYTMPEGSERWLIDPIDGTFCFKNGNPDFSITIALQKKINGEWKTEIGAVAVPMRDQIYLAHESSSYLVEGDRAKQLEVNAKDANAFEGSLDDVFRGKKIESVIYSKTKPEFMDLRQSVSKRLAKVGAVQHSFSSAIMIAKMADGWLDGVILAANALDYAWDTDAAIHIAEKAGAKVVHQEIGGEPCVLIANSQTTLTALSHLVEQEYKKAISSRRVQGS